MKLLIALSLTFFQPSVLYWFNPYANAIADDISLFRPKKALILAFIVGLFRDILLSSPRFGLLGLSSALACLGTNMTVRYFSIEGMLNLPVVFCFTCTEALIDALLCAFFAPSSSEFSVQQSFIYVTYSCLYAFAYFASGTLCKRFSPVRTAT